MEQEEDTLPPPLEEVLGQDAGVASAAAAPLHTAARGEPAAIVEPHPARLPSGIGMVADTRLEAAEAAAGNVAGPGWFGKLASLGDFASRRLPEAFVAQCDSWLSHGVAASRQQLGERWLDIYLTAPLWRFALAPGVAGESWWLGALMPSVDRVGRYFPLLVCESFARAPTNRAELEAAERWFDHLAAAALSTLQREATIESFEGRLQAAPRWPSAGASSLPRASRSADHERYWAARSMPLAGWLAGIGAVQLLHSLQGRSLWWAPPAAGGGAGAFSIAAGWPPAERFCELLEGRW